MLKSKLKLSRLKENKARCAIIFLSIIVLIVIGISVKYIYNKYAQESKMLAKFSVYYEGDEDNIKKTSEQKERFSVGVSNIPSDKEIYSHDTEAGRTVNNLVFQSLININTDMKITKKIADKIEFSDDGMSATVELKAVKFSDGKEVSADDIKNSYKYLCSSESQYYDKNKMCVIDGMTEYLSGSSKDISGIECIDDSTIKFSFKENTAMNIMSLTLPIVKIDENNIYALGAGPYKISKIVYMNSIELVTNDYCNDNPYEYKKISLKTIPLNNLEKDISEFNLDMFYTNSGDVLDIIKDSNYHNVYKTRNENYYYLGFNLSSKKASDINLRKAVAFSINRNTLCDSFYGLKDKTVPLGITSADKAKNNFTTEIETDSDDAKGYLEDAPSDSENLTYICPNEASSYSFYEQIKSELENADINLSAEKLDEEEYNNRMSELASGKAAGDMYFSSLNGLNAIKLIENAVSFNSELKNEYEDMLKQSYKNGPEKVFENIESFCCEKVLFIPLVTSCDYIAVSADCDNELMMELFY